MQVSSLNRQGFQRDCRYETETERERERTKPLLSFLNYFQVQNIECKIQGTENKIIKYKIQNAKDAKLRQK